MLRSWENKIEETQNHNSGQQLKSHSKPRQSICRTPARLCQQQCVSTQCLRDCGEVKLWQLIRGKGVDGMAEAVERNVVPRILGVVLAQLSHSSTKLEDSHHVELVGRLNRGSAEPLQTHEPNVVPRSLGILPAQLSHSSTMPEDSHHAEIVGKLDRGDGEPQQQPAIKKPHDEMHADTIPASKHAEPQQQPSSP